MTLHHTLQVQTAAREALAEVGRVIGSPEMAALVPSLLAAIADPNTATKVRGGLSNSSAFAAEERVQCS